MSKINSRSIIIILAVIAIVIPLSVYFVIEVRSSMKRIQYESDMLYLRSCINEELQEYYEKNGNYPENLQLIWDTIPDRQFVSHLPEKYKDGHVLDEFKYSTDRPSYTMILEIRASGKKYIEKGLKGEKGRLELYIDGEKIY